MIRRNYLFLASILLLGFILSFGTTASAAKVPSSKIIKQLNSKNSKLTKHVHSLQAENLRLKKQVSALEKTNKNLSNSNSQLNKSNSALKTSNGKLTSQNYALNKTVASKNSTINSLNSRVATPLSNKVAYEGNVQSGLIQYHGIQYVPVNLISNMIKLASTYDKKSNTTYIGDGTNGLMMSDIVPVYYSSAGYRNYAVNDSITMAGVDYTKGYSFYADDNTTNTYSLNLQGKYSEIKGLFGFEDLSDIGTVSVNILGDGKALKTFSLQGGQLPITLDIPVKGIKRLDFKLTPNNNSTSVDFDFVNVHIK